MLVVTKIGQRKKLIVYSIVIIAMFSSGIFSVYQYFINIIDLEAPEIVIPAYSPRDIFLLEEKSEEDIDSELIIETEDHKISEILNLNIFNDPKFRSLRRNPSIRINVNPGKRNPFVP